MTKRRGILILTVAIFLAVDGWLLAGRAAVATEQPNVLLSITTSSWTTGDPQGLAQLMADAKSWTFAGKSVVRPPAQRLDGSAWEGEAGAPGVGAVIGLGSDRSFGRAIEATRLLATLGICGVAIPDPDFRDSSEMVEGAVLAIRQVRNDSGQMEQCVPHPSYLAPDDPRLGAGA